MCCVWFIATSVGVPDIQNEQRTFKNQKVVTAVCRGCGEAVKWGLSRLPGRGGVVDAATLREVCAFACFPGPGEAARAASAHQPAKTDQAPTTTSLLWPHRVRIACRAQAGRADLSIPSTTPPVVAHFRQRPQFLVDQRTLDRASPST